MIYDVVHRTTYRYEEPVDLSYHVMRLTPRGLPWQRVLRSDGRIAFPPGTRAFREQVRRLAGEGVLVRSGRVDLALHGWERDLDTQLWGPAVAPAAPAMAPAPQACEPSMVMKIVRKVTRSAPKR